MIKTLILIVLLSLSISRSYSQYIHYDTNPIVTPEPITVPQMPMMPPRRFFPPIADANPTISILSKFLIQSAKVNCKDFSQHYINANAGIAIYKISNDISTFMAVVMPGDNSDSHGKMLAITNKEVPQTTTEYGKTITNFAWEFVNSADGKNGSATVTIVKEYRKEGTVVKCHITATNGTVCDFEGVMGQ